MKFTTLINTRHVLQQEYEITLDLQTPFQKCSLNYADIDFLHCSCTLAGKHTPTRRALCIQLASHYAVMWIKNVRPRMQHPFNLPINGCVLLSAGSGGSRCVYCLQQQQRRWRWRQLRYRCSASSSRLQPAFVLFTTVGKLRGSRVIFQCSVSART